VFRVDLEATIRFPCDSGRLDGPRWARSGRISIGNCWGRGSRLFHRRAWKARSDALCVAPAAGHFAPPQRTFGAPHAAPQNWWKCLTL
jgi:hypothetical protein